MSPTNSVPTILIISGSVGASAEQVVHTVLAQFPEDSVQVKKMAHVRQPEQISEALQQAKSTGALVVYTLVDLKLHQYLLDEARRLQVDAVDLMGPIMQWIQQKTGKQPKGQPGLYRQLNREYFERVEAIDFAITHDDGKKPEGWPHAEAVLVGVSRVGKTPLSLYLAVLGWKVANYPFVPQVQIPQTLFQIDPKRVVGLTIEPSQLLQYRLQRQKQMGAPGHSAYVDLQAIYEEVQEAYKIFRRSGFAVIDMTDKTIEMGADEIIRHLSKR